MTTAKSHWQIDTERLAREIRSAASSARTEEDLKLRVAPLLQRVLRDSGIDVDAVQYEKATALSAKRMDAVYGYLIIEYKAPGRIGPARDRSAVVKQLEGYLQEEASRHGKHHEGFLEKAVGVALDGEQILFVRYSRKPQVLVTPVPVPTDQKDFFPEIEPRQGFQVQGPFPVNSHSLASLLIYVRSTARRPLTANNLADVFGPGNEVARVAVAELYSAVMRGQRRSAYPRLTSFYVSCSGDLARERVRRPTTTCPHRGDRTSDSQRRSRFRSQSARRARGAHQLFNCLCAVPTLRPTFFHSGLSLRFSGSTRLLH